MSCSDLCTLKCKSESEEKRGACTNLCSNQCKASQELESIEKVYKPMAEATESENIQDTE